MLVISINTKERVIDIARMTALQNDAEFERKHKRDKDGKFASGDGAVPSNGKIKSSYKSKKRQYNTEYPPCGRTRLDSALAQSLSSHDKKGTNKKG